MKIDSLWCNANIATMALGAGYGVLVEGVMAIAEGKIAWIGKEKDLPKQYDLPTNKRHDVHGRWITPGLIDCHTHLIYGGQRANEFELRLQGVSYQQIARAGGGIHATVAATRATTEQTLYEVSARRLLALFAEGVTTIEIKSGYGLSLANEMKILRVARQLGQQSPLTVMTTFLGAHAVPIEYEGKADAYIEFLCETVLPAAVAENLVDAVDAFCETVGFTPQQVTKLFNVAKRYGLPVKLHAEQLSDQNGARLAAEYQALSADHLEYISEQSVVAMAKAGTVAVLLPGAFYFLRETRIPPIALFRQYKVPIAIATDCNPGTSPIVSLLSILNMACTLFRMTPEEALLGVTWNAAKALGLQKDYGSLEVGKMADFVIWDIESPAELAYYLGYNPCLSVIKKGKVYDRRNAF